MKKSLASILALFIAALGITGCGDGPPVIHDLSSQDFRLIDSDSAAVNFPSDFEGEKLVVGFIYTHCPDICPVTTANMKTAYRQLQDTSGVQFIGITFDPQRDTPAVLKQYKENFELPDQHFAMLTGDSATVDSVLQMMDIEANISYTDTSDTNNTAYYMNHTDRISIMDSRGRVRFEYPGSKVPPEHIVEDLDKIGNGWF